MTFFRYFSVNRLVPISCPQFRCNVRKENTSNTLRSAYKSQNDGNQKVLKRWPVFRSSGM